MDYREDATDRRPTGADDHPSDAADANPAAGTERSGDFSRDPTFDPEQLFEVIGREDNDARVADAMRTFIRHGEVANFEQAVAVFVRSARARGEPVERVLAMLIGLAEAWEGTAYPHDWTLSDLRWVVLRGVLLAFYGDTSLAAREAGIERRTSGGRRQADSRSPTGGQSEVL